MKPSLPEVECKQRSALHSDEVATIHFKVGSGDYLSQECHRLNEEPLKSAWTKHTFPPQLNSSWNPCQKKRSQNLFFFTILHLEGWQVVVMRLECKYWTTRNMEHSFLHWLGTNRSSFNKFKLKSSLDMYFFFFLYFFLVFIYLFST